MAERILKSYDPYAYHVNNVGDFMKDVVKAFKKDDTASMETQLMSADRLDLDVFICVNQSYHAFVLCSPNPDNLQELDPLKMHPEFSTNPEDIPCLMLVHQLELCFDDEKSRMYRIRWKMDTFVNVKERIKRAYWIGHYSGVSVVAIQLAALRASPNQYRVLLDDCVEFAKKFCNELLVHASNKSILAEEVKSQIRLTTSSGFTVEQLSRNIQSSAYSMNTFLGGLDISSYMLTNRFGILITLLFILILVYPPLIIWYMKN